MFSRLQYSPGEPWPLWKLVAALYLIEAKVGHATARRIGAQIFSTMPWPNEVKTLEDALSGLDGAYRAAHGGAPRSLVGGWKVEPAGEGRLVIRNDTFSPCWLEEGVILGICAAFPKAKASFTIDRTKPGKRDGGTESVYLLDYVP